MAKKLVKGPKDGKVTQTSFVDSSKKGGSKSLFPSLKITKDLVLLSIAGNELCAGEYLQGIVKQAVANHEGTLGPGEQRGKTTFLIADEIYWHNLKELDPKDNDVAALKSQALQLGDRYFTDNIAAFLAPLGLTAEEFNKEHGEKTVNEKISIINQLAADQGKNFEIVRWRTWVNQDSANQIERMIPLYESVEGLNDSISLAVNDFAKRHSDNGDTGSEELWKHRSKDYLTEECPSVMWLAASLEYNFVIYPGEMIPPFGTTKDFFVVKEHKARIENGVNIKETCTHSELCIHVKDPRRLVNWLEVHFQKSLLAQPKKPEVTESERSDPTPTTPILSVQTPTKATESVLGSPLTFFPPSPKPVGPLDSNDNNQQSKPRSGFLLERTVDHTDSTDNESVLNEQTILLNSLLRGVNQALQQDVHQVPLKKRTSKKTQEHDASSELLTDMFRGLALGIMDTTTVDEATKLNILTKLVEDFTSKHIPQIQLSLQKKTSESCPASGPIESGHKTTRVL